MRRIGILFSAVFLLAGCSSSEIRVAHTVGLVPATETIPEEQLLDVSVVLLDPGVPEGEIDKDVLEELLREGTFVHIRRSESRYMAVHLRDTLQKSGHWGAVWVTPTPSLASDLEVTGAILHSDGTIWLKGQGAFADELTQAGWPRWSYQRDGGKETFMPYWRLPDDLLDDATAACAWANRALAALS